MSNAKSVSVVIPTYRRPELLRKCLASIRAQTFPDTDFEVVVVADGKDSSSALLVEDFQNEFPNFDLHYLELPSKKGPAAARNMGWQNAVGTLIVFTDDDCIVSPDWLAAYWEAYQYFGKKVISFTGPVEVPIPSLPTDYQKNISHLATADFITANCACSREALELIKGFDEEFPAAWREDSALEFELLRHQVQITKIAKACITHPVREAEWGVSIAEQKKSMFNALLFKKYPDFYRKKIAAGPAWKYYLIILSSILTIAGLLSGSALMAIAGALIWLPTVVVFIYKRLKGTDVSTSHRLEMIITSFVIPYLSVYWTLRGAIRYKVFFL